MTSVLTRILTLLNSKHATEPRSNVLREITENSRRSAIDGVEDNSLLPSSPSKKRKTSNSSTSASDNLVLLPPLSFIQHDTSAAPSAIDGRQQNAVRSRDADALTATAPRENLESGDT